MFNEHGALRVERPVRAIGRLGLSPDPDPRSRSTSCHCRPMLHWIPTIPSIPNPRGIPCPSLHDRSRRTKRTKTTTPGRLPCRTRSRFPGTKSPIRFPSVEHQSHWRSRFRTPSRRPNCSRTRRSRWPNRFRTTSPRQNHLPTRIRCRTRWSMNSSFHYRRRGPPFGSRTPRPRHLDRQSSREYARGSSQRPRRPGGQRLKQQGAWYAGVTSSVRNPERSLETIGNNAM